MAPHHDYVPGCTYLTCTFCGRRRLFPDELALCDDKKFRCLDACMEKSIMSIDREIAASHYKREAPPLGIGYASQFDRGTTFLEDSVDRRSVLLPGWTPSSTLYDDFTVVGGGVGSSWTPQIAGGGLISQPAAGVTRLTSGTSGGARIQLTSFTVPLPSAGRFYCRVRFTTPAIGDTSPILAMGVGTTPGNSQRLSIGFRGNSAAGNSYYQLVSQAVDHVISTVQADTTLYHTGEMWWNGNGYVYGSVDGSGPTMTVPTSGASAKFPLIIVNPGVSLPMTVDVSDYYCAA